jgi:hypothetical protein
MKKLILLGIVLVGQAALADTPQLKIARDELEVRRENQRYAEAEYRRSKINYLTANKLLATSIKAVKYYEEAEELSRQAAVTSEDSHVRIGATYVHEPRAAGTGIRMVGR